MTQQLHHKSAKKREGIISVYFQKCGNLFYSDGELSTERRPEFLRTWANVANLEGVESGVLYTQGLPLETVAPNNCKAELKEASKKMQAYSRALATAKVELRDRRLVELIPEKALKHFLELKNRVTEHVFETYERPSNYDFLESVYRLLNRIGTQPLNLELNALKSESHSLPAREFWKTATKASPYVILDMFKSKTVRLTTCRGSFPIMTMAKKYRGIVRPQNDFFVELDYNAAELRVLLGLSNTPQPAEDIHEWNRTEIYKSLPTRDEAKRRIFAWLYNPASRDQESAGVYKKDEIVAQHFQEGTVTTPFGRTIPCDKFHALNYLIQSTASDLTLGSAVEIASYLDGNGSQSFVAFTMHDSIVLDMKEEDLKYVEHISDIYGNTLWGKFRVNTKIGYDYGSLEEYIDEENK